MKNVFILVLFAIGFSFNSCKKEEVENEERQIRQLWSRASQALCNGNWESYSECWSHSSDIQLIHTDQGEWLNGWEEIKPKYKEMLSSGFSCKIPKNELKLNISSSADMAWGTVNILIHFNDTAKTEMNLWETVIFEKIDGKWKIVHGMVSIPGSTKE